MDIVVLVKQVPDSGSERKMDAADNTVARAAADNVVNEIDEYAIEEALVVKEAHGGEVTVLTVGPDSATDAIRKALSMGADKAVHVSDEAIHGSDAAATSLILAEAVKKAGGGEAPQLVLTGMSSTDGVMGVVPAMVAERLGLPQVTYASELTIDGDKVSIRRDGDVASETIESTLPALVSVTDQINEPRYPSFKGIMAAKKKPVETWSLADLGVDAGQVGLANSWTEVLETTKRPPREQGEIVKDEGDGGTKLAEFLAAQKFI